MNSKKRILGLIIAIVFLFVISYNVSAVVEPTREFYVNDYANLLSNETQKYIISVNRNLNSQTKAQVVVVTIPTLEGDSLEEYSTELFRSFGIGDKKLNNGVLILIALQERECRIEVGYGLEGVLNDAKTGRIQDNYMIPYLKDDNWDAGIKNGFNAIIEELEGEYNVNIGNAEPADNSGDINNVRVQMYLWSVIFGMPALIMNFACKGKRKKLKIVYLFVVPILVYLFNGNFLVVVTCTLICFFMLYFSSFNGRWSLLSFWFSWRSRKFRISWGWRFFRWRRKL